MDPNRPASSDPRPVDISQVDQEDTPIVKPQDEALHREALYIFSEAHSTDLDPETEILAADLSNPQEPSDTQSRMSKTMNKIKDWTPNDSPLQKLIGGDFKGAKDQYVQNLKKMGSFFPKLASQGLSKAFNTHISKDGVKLPPKLKDKDVETLLKTHPFVDKKAALSAEELMEGKESETLFKAGTITYETKLGMDTDSTPVTLTLEDDVVLVRGAFLPEDKDEGGVHERAHGMKGPSDVLIMSARDFKKFSDYSKNMHLQAFDRDYRVLSDGRVMVFKVPAEVSRASRINESGSSEKIKLSKPISVAVGKASMHADRSAAGSRPGTEDTNGIKMRIDSSESSAASIHHIKITDGNKKDTEVAAFSSAYFCDNFWKPTESELTAIQTTLDQLAGLGIKAYYCESHHVLVFDENQNMDSPTTPQQLADILRDLDKGPQLLAILQKGAIPKKKEEVKAWAETMKAAYPAK